MRDALLAGLLAGLAAGLGGALIAVLPKITRQLYDTLLGFSAGVMLATGTITLLWPALRQGNAVQPSLGLLCGAMLVFLLERSVPHLEPHFAPELNGPEKRLGLLLSAAITLHHIPEGLAIGVAFAGQGKAVGSVVALAIAMQNIAAPDRRPANAAFPRGEAQRIQQDRFARAGFPGQHVQAGRELEFRPFDQDDVANGQRGQHGLLLSDSLRTPPGMPC